MISYKKLFYFLLLFMLCPFGYAQFRDIKFEHITTANGLPQSTIHGIVKDRHGFMWFGTWSGLCRYDGYQFKVYRYQPEEPHSIINNRIHNIILDQKGQLWILTFDTEYLCKYNETSDNFERIPIQQVPSEIAANIQRRAHVANSKYAYKSNNWTVDIANNTLVETDIATQLKKIHYPNLADPWSLNSAHISDIYLDDQHILWVGTYTNGINKANLAGKPFHYWYHDPQNSNSIIEPTVRAITEDQTGNIWIGTRNEGISVRSPKGTFRHFRQEGPGSLSSNNIKSILCDSEGRIWIGTQRGLNYYDETTQRIKHYPFAPLDKTSVFGIFEDHDKNLWIASGGDGIYKYQLKSQSFIRYNRSDLIPSRYIACIMKDSQDRIWVGTEGEGISVLQEEDGHLRKLFSLQHDSNQISTISDNRIYSLYEDVEQNVWIGTGNGLDKYDSHSKQISHWSGSPQGIPPGSVAGVLSDQQGNIWVSHKKGISQIQLQTQTVRNFSRQNGLQSDEFLEGSTFKSKTSNVLYFGGNEGVNFFDPDSIQINYTPPSVLLTDVKILNESIEVQKVVNGRILLKQPIHLSKTLDLNYKDKSITLTFAALDYSNPNGTKYAYMLEGLDKDWNYTDATMRSANYSNLKPGSYVFKVKAANNDGIWSETPTSLNIQVAPPWWASTAAYTTYCLFILAALLASYYYVIRYTRMKSKLQYEALLRQQEHTHHQNKVRFFTHIAHEIKTPLTLILSPIQQLSKQAGTTPSHQKLIQTLQKHGENLRNIVQQLLTIERLESGEEPVLLSKGDLVSFIQEQVDSFSDYAVQHHVHLQFKSNRPSLDLHFDQDKLQKILNNLLANAIKFSHQGGNVHCELSVSENSYQIVVRDNGIGIPTEQIGQLFKPFVHREDHNPTGTGLGLHYSKTLVELLGGSIHADSQQLDHENQTTFTVKFPLREAIAAASEQVVSLPESIDLTETEQENETRDEQPIVFSEKPTILIVEDNNDMRQFLADYFQAFYHILQATDGHQGLALLQKHVPDLVISDVMMPNMDGISFCTHVKSDPLTAHIPVILLTAQALAEQEERGLRIGADDYITKPFQIDLLALKVRNQLMIRIHLQEKFRLKLGINPAPLEVASADDRLMAKILQFVEENLANSDLKIDDICTAVGISRSQLNRKVKAIVGYTMTDLIKETRLKRAQQLLREKKFQISEIAYMCGFSDADYFRKNFKAHFGQSPTDYAKQYNG